MCGKADGRGSKLWPVASMPLPAPPAISSFSCAMAATRGHAGPVPGAVVRRAAGAADLGRQGKDDGGGIRAANCGSPGSVQGTGPAAGQQGSDPARNRRPAARHAELRPDERVAGGQDPSSGLGARDHAQGIRRGGIDLLPRRWPRRLRHLWREVRQWGRGNPALARSGRQGRRRHLQARRQR